MFRVDLVGWSLVLIALAMGYSVCVKASRADNRTIKMIGYIIGIIVIAASLVLALSDLGTRIRTRRGTPMLPGRPAAGIPTRPFNAPNVNMPTMPRAPKAVIQPAPAVPNIPAPPAAPKVQ